MNAKYIEYNGEKHTIKEWAEKSGIRYNTLRKRLEIMPAEEAFAQCSTPEHVGKRNTAKKYEMNGEVHSVTEWARIYNKPRHIVANRVQKGMSIKDALTRPVGAGRQKLYSFHGKKYSIQDLSKLSGVPCETIRSRIAYGWDIETAVTKPSRGYSVRAGQRCSSYDKSGGCKRYDCLHQDGSGKCQLGFRNHKKCNDKFEDAYEYYFKNDRKYNKASGDIWAKDRQKLLTGYIVCQQA